MTALVWVSILGGLAIVILAVGIPYLLTHKNMNNPHDTSEGRAYLRAKGRWQRRARRRQPANSGSHDSSPGSMPGGI